MEQFQKIFNQHRLYFTGIILFALVSAAILLFFTKGDGFILMNEHHNHYFDQFFTLFTNLGDGIFIIGIVILLAVFRQVEIARQMLLAFLISGLIVQLFKNTITSPRPTTFFTHSPIHILDGITLKGNSSFPSGHTATIFAFATVLSFFTRNNLVICLYLLMAILVGYSRIYLSQHFLKDVLAGSMIGVIVAIFVHYYLDIQVDRWLKKKFKKNYSG
jgi:membrane-associated phospholipid phosphatase